MMKTKNIFAVSFIAMFAVGTSRATIVTQENIVGKNGIGVSVNETTKKVEVANNPFYGTGVGGATSAAKTVSIPGITTLSEGQMIVVNPQTTHQTSTGYANSCTIKLNDFAAAPITYNGTAATRYTCNYVWTANRPAVFVYDGSNWAFVGGYDLNSTYTVMSVAEMTEGTLTNGRLITPAQFATKQDKLDATASTGNILGTGSVTVTTPTTGDNAGKVVINSPTLATVATSGSYNDLSNKPTLGSLAAKSTVTSSDITNGTIVSDDIANNTIAKEKLASGVQTSLDKADAAAAGTNKVNGAPLSNAETYFYGTSSTAAATAQKDVSIPSITELKAGQFIVVKPTVTSTVADSTIKLNSFTAYPMRYNNAAITTSTDSVVWSANILSIFVFDGTYWQFVGHGLDSNTTYSAMSVDEGRTGTATSSRTMRADYLKQIVQGTSSANGLATDAVLGRDYAKAETASDVATTDTIKGAIGKLEKKADDAAAAASAAADAQVNADWNATSGKAQILNKPTLATVATSGSYNDLSNKPTIPTVNNKTITIQKNGTDVDSFTTNASANKAINITVSKSDVGLGNVDNTSDANKPISTATQTALNGKQDKLDATASTGNIKGTNGVTVQTPTTGDDAGKVVISGPGTINNATLTIQKNGTTVKTFTANASSNVTANITVPTQPSDIGAAAASHTHASSDVNAMTGYAKAQTAAAIEATDSLNTAIGKLEKALDGKQNSLTIDTAMSSTSTNPVQNKVVNTELGKKVNTAQGSGNANKAVITNSSGNITTGTITSGMITDGTIANADIASNAAIAVSKISGAQTTANIVGTTEGLTNEQLTSTSTYPSMKAATEMLNAQSEELTTSISNLADVAVKHTPNSAAGSASIPVYVTAAGAATAITQFGTIANNDTAGAGGSLLKGKTVYTEVRPSATTSAGGYLANQAVKTNLTALDTAIKTIHPNTGEVKIPSGSETSSTLASIWVE